MPPDPPAFAPQRILEVLARHEVRCVVIGGYAAVLAGVEIVTRDVDIIPALDADNMERLAPALEELHAGIRVPNEPPIPLPADPKLLAKAQIWNLATDAGDLDITTRPDGTNGYEDLRRGAYATSSAAGCISRWLPCRTSSEARPLPAARKTSPALPQLRAALAREQP